MDGRTFVWSGAEKGLKGGKYVINLSRERADSIHLWLTSSLTNERCGKGVGRKQSSLALRVNIKRNVERKDAMARVWRLEKPSFLWKRKGREGGRDSREFSIERALLQVQRDGWRQPLDSRPIKSINAARARARALEEEEEACPCFLYWEQLLFNPSSSERERFLL